MASRRIIYLIASALIVDESARSQPSSFVPVTDRMLERPDPGDWLSWRRTLNGWGYSPLTQIHRGNVRYLRLEWTRAMRPGLQEATPLAYGGILYLPNPADCMQAIDARTGDLLWEYRRKWPADLKSVFSVPEVVEINRNVAIYGTTILDTTADDHLIALDAVSGELRWERQVLDYHVHPAYQTSGPIVAKGKIISGRGCEPRGGPEACVITAHAAATGKELWRTRTIPKPGEPGDETWGGLPFEQRKHVGTWMVPSYDPETNLIYIGTSVTSPAPKFMLAGNDHQYLYHNCTLALNGDTGKIVWYYQHLVDHWDMDHTFERLIVDTEVRPDKDHVQWINPKLKMGERRRVITGIPGKTGIIYTLDAKTGEFLWARPTVVQNLVTSIDGATGKVKVNPDTLFSDVGQKREICPSLGGGKNWSAGAYSPDTNLMYFSLENACASITALSPTPPNLYRIYSSIKMAPGTDNVGTIEAISAATGATAWKYQQRAATTALLATGGGLLFAGDENGRFRALDQNTGVVLWGINLGSPVTGFPITFTVGGRQYVAVSTGMSLNSPRFKRLTPELAPAEGNNVFVFALPE